MMSVKITEKELKQRILDVVNKGIESKNKGLLCDVDYEIMIKNISDAVINNLPQSKDGITEIIYE